MTIFLLSQEFNCRRNSVVVTRVLFCRDRNSVLFVQVLCFVGTGILFCWDRNSVLLGHVFFSVRTGILFQIVIGSTPAALPSEHLSKE